MRALRTFGVYVKNVGTETFDVDELPGVSIAVDEEVDLTDPTLANYYRDPTAAKRAIEDLTGTSLYAGVHAVPPVLTVRYAPKMTEEHEE